MVNHSSGGAIVGLVGMYVLSTILLSPFAAPASALFHVPSSPCASRCSDQIAGTLENDTVCLDTSFASGRGARFQDCTTCLLNSSAVDSGKSLSDVYWGLFNLRYALSECMFAHPSEIVSISSPCQVTCASLQRGVTYGIGADASTATQGVVPNLDFCQNGLDSDFAINNCTFCYQFVPQQLYLGNFMQALHIACRSPPRLGDSFYPDGRAIFNETVIAGPVPPSVNTGGGGLSGVKLALAIVLPLVGGILLFALTCFCCWRFTKGRRQRMAAEGRMKRFYDGMAMGQSNDGSPMPGDMYPIQSDWPVGQYEPAREMSQLHRTTAGRQKSPAVSPSGWYGEQEDVPEIGPGHDQVHDPYLHERYFGLATSPEDEVPIPGPHMTPGGPVILPHDRSHWS